MVKSVNTNKVEMDKKAAIAVVFENPEFGKIRTLTDENGEPSVQRISVIYWGIKNQETL